MKLLKRKASSNVGPREFWVNSDEYQLRIMPFLILAMTFADIALTLRQVDYYTTRIWPSVIASLVLVLAAVLSIICSRRYETHFGKFPERKKIWTALKDIPNSVWVGYTYITLCMPLIVFFTVRGEQSVYCAAWLLLIYDSGLFLMKIIYTIKLHRRIQRAKDADRASRL